MNPSAQEQDACYTGNLIKWDYNYVENFAPFFEILPEDVSSLTPSKSFLNESTTSKIL